MLGIAFQVQDDLLKLCGGMQSYGKEVYADLYERKRMLMLN
jgi:geranylgeranyl pyrophosphate synthase